MNDIKNSSILLKDFLSGYEDVLNRPEYKNLSIKDVYRAYNYLLNNPNLSNVEKLDLASNNWKIHYRKKPPTIEELLSETFLGATSESIYSYVKEKLIEFWDPKSYYKTCVLYPHIGWGKSFFSVLCNLYLVVHLVYMRDAKKYFGLSPATTLTQVLISFNLNQAHDLLLDPFLNILQSTDIFERVKTTEILNKKNKQNDLSKIYWTTAHPTSALTFSNGVNIKLVSQPSSLLGQTIILGTMSELAFFSERGFSQDMIMKLFDDLSKRIFSRMDGNYWGRVLIDTSPNDAEENEIEKWIANEARNKKDIFLIEGAQWEWQKWKYEGVKETFPVFKGNQSKPPKILKEEELYEYNDVDIIHVPDKEDIRKEFEQNTTKALKDIAGIPAGNSDKLIQNKENIEKLFIPHLRNIYTHIYAPSDQAPEGLIWDVIYKDFFIDVGSKYEFYRNPLAPRFISIDQSISGDTTAIVMCHSEIDILTNEIVYIIDFSIAIHPNKSRINLEAIKFFIYDLKRKGHINIVRVSYDRFESESSIQFLKRYEIPVERLSVDETTAPYLSFISLLNTNRIKMGKNIYMKNNLKSLIMIRRVKTLTPKVEHSIGKLTKADADNDWNTSSMGLHAKDISDAASASVELCSRYSTIPIYLWDEEQLTICKDSPKLKAKILDNVSKRYGYKAMY